MDFALYRTIARQGGVFTVDQALDSCSDAEVRRPVRSGRWRRSRWRGVLVDGDVPDSFAVQLRAASLLVGSDLVACHATAARLWEFDVLGDDTLHFLGPPSLVNRSRPGIRVHPSSLGTEDAVLVDGIWCTPAARTACDVVRLTPPIDGLATLDAALLRLLPQGGPRGRGRGAGGPAAGGAAAPAGALGRSPGGLADGVADAVALPRCRLPAPDLQVKVPAEGRARWLDLGWREERVGAEFDGQEAHMTPEQLRDDRRRHNWLTENSWPLLHFTKHDVYRAHRQMLAVTARALRLPPRSW
ncbi:hypothetical protein [Geodermatophilus sp. SYSU D00815]